MFLGLRSLIYPAPDLAAAKDWYTRVLGIEPYFDEPFYVGYDVGGYELGLHPGGDPAAGPKTYWGVADIETAHAQLIGAGATPLDPIAEVGEGIKMAAVLDPAGYVLGVIENPHFSTGETPDH
jgi:catechol 2,3-dioxygenase-like lactoylglutathione lyase family enzyme